MRRFIHRIATAGELLSFFWNNRMWWLTPVVALLFMMGIVAVAVQSSAIAPFIYTLF